MDLTNKKCVPCEIGGIPLSETEVRGEMPQIPKWLLSSDSKKISRKFSFKNFVQSLEFVNKVGMLAESEGHHPDITINYNKVTLELTTHAIGGLSLNDFIMAQKIDSL